jgi:hypothetical protein
MGQNKTVKGGKKKRYQKNSASQKMTESNPIVFECIESRKIVYPETRKWIGQNLNNELIY